MRINKNTQSDNAMDTVDDTFSIQNVDENSRLLSYHSINSEESSSMQKGRHVFYVICLIFILFIGLVTGCYLLSTEGEEKIIRENRLKIIGLSEWNFYYVTNRTFMEKLKLPVTQVHFVETLTRNCHIELECFQLVQELQLKHVRNSSQTDLLDHNFIVTGDGVVYEGRGWNFRSNYVKYLIMAFTGNDTITWRQAKSAKWLLEFGAIEGNVIPCYQIHSHGSVSLNATADSILGKVARECKKNGSS